MTEAMTVVTGNPNVTATYACNNNWLENTTGGNYGGGGAAGGAIGNVQNLGCYPSTGNYYWPSLQPYYYPVYYSSPTRPIKLTMSEVERLRKAARADEKLKAILSKFTSQIEITVDFE